MASGRCAKWCRLFACVTVAVGLTTSPLMPATADARTATPAAGTAAKSGAVASAATRAMTETAGALVSVKPTRLLDTRFGTGAARARIQPGTALTVQLTGRDPLPASGVGAIVAAVSVISPTGSGYLTVSAAGSSAKSTIVNFTANAGMTNTAILPVSGAGRVTFTNVGTGPIDLAADVTGYYAAGTATTAGTLESVTPTRLLDDRVGIGAPRARIGAGRSVTVTFSGRGPIPASGVGSVVATVTVIAPTAAGFLTVEPAGSPARATIVNFVAGHGITDTAVLPLGTAGQVTFTNNGPATIDLAADVTGYFRAGTPAAAGAFVSASPVRLLDSRDGIGSPAARITPGGSVTIVLAGHSPVPNTGAAAVIAAVTVVSPTNTGFLTASALGSIGRATIVNFQKDHGTTGTSILPLGTDGSITITNNGGATIDLVADIFGYVTSDSGRQTIPHSWVSENRIAGNGRGNVVAASCPTTTFCLMAGEGDYSIETTGVWSSPADYPFAFPVSSASCVSASFCAAVSPTGYIASFNGTAWSSGILADATPAGTGRALDSISCATASFCLAFDRAGYYTKWNGTTWAPAVPAFRLNGRRAGRVLSHDGILHGPIPDGSICCLRRVGLDRPNRRPAGRERSRLRHAHLLPARSGHRARNMERDRLGNASSRLRIGPSRAPTAPKPTPAHFVDAAGEDYRLIAGLEISAVPAIPPASGYVHQLSKPPSTCLAADTFGWAAPVSRRRARERWSGSICSAPSPVCPAPTPDLLRRRDRRRTNRHRHQRNLERSTFHTADGHPWRLGRLVLISELLRGSRRRWIRNDVRRDFLDCPHRRRPTLQRRPAGRWGLPTSPAPVQIFVFWPTTTATSPPIGTGIGAHHRVSPPAR